MSLKHKSLFNELKKGYTSFFPLPGPVDQYHDEHVAWKRCALYSLENMFPRLEKKANPVGCAHKPETRKLDVNMEKDPVEGSEAIVYSGVLTTSSQRRKVAIKVIWRNKESPDEYWAQVVAVANELITHVMAYAAKPTKVIRIFDVIWRPDYFLVIMDQALMDLLYFIYDENPNNRYPFDARLWPSERDPVKLDSDWHSPVKEDTFYEYKQVIWEKDMHCIFQQLVDGLDALHRQKIYHRDIKIENILVMGRSKRGCPKVIFSDFGRGWQTKYSMPPGIRSALGTYHLLPEMCFKEKEYANIDVKHFEDVDFYSLIASLHKLLFFEKDERPDIGEKKFTSRVLSKDEIKDSLMTKGLQTLLKSVLEVTLPLPNGQTISQTVKENMGRWARSLDKKEEELRKSLIEMERRQRPVKMRSARRTSIG
ncbi:MAG: kinase-like domain-containing protein [Piptocephalis tieghemiana]|nr:MAG: kinase-like domain-containing protein [Piptocephalis tieghemiana]